MKVTIDTKEDKIEDIHKILEILTHILQQKSGLSSSGGGNVDTSTMMGMFDSDGGVNTDKLDRAPDFSGFLNLTKNAKVDEKKEMPQIEFF